MPAHIAFLYVYPYSYIHTHSTFLHIHIYAYLYTHTQTCVYYMVHILGPSPLSRGTGAPGPRSSRATAPTRARNHSETLAVQLPTGGQYREIRDYILKNDYVEIIFANHRCILVRLCRDYVLLFPTTTSKMTGCWRKTGSHEEKRMENEMGAGEGRATKYLCDSRRRAVCAEAILPGGYGN